MDGTGLKNGKLFSGQVYEIGPALQLVNLLAADVEVRVAEKPDKQKEAIVHWTNSIPRGEQKPVHVLMSSSPAYIQLRVPSLATEWSMLLALPAVPLEGRASFTSSVSLFDSAKRELQVNLEMSIKGTIKVVLYVPYFVYDLTSLGLIVSCDGLSTVPLGPLDSLRRTITEDKRTPVMFNFPQGYLKSKDVRLTTLHGVENARTWNDVQWSTPIGINQVGLSMTTTIPGALQQMEGDPAATLRNLSDVSHTHTHARMSPKLLLVLFHFSLPFLVFARLTDRCVRDARLRQIPPHQAHPPHAALRVPQQSEL